MTLPQLVNQNSYTLAALLLLLFATPILLMRTRRKRVTLAILFALVFLFGAANLIFRVGATDIESVAQFDQLVAARQPVMLEIYSNY